MLAFIRKNLVSLGGLLALLCLTLVIIVIVSQVAGVRVDLTEARLYTLSQGSRNIVQNLQAPVELEFFYSESVSRNIPAFRNYARRVQEILHEYELLSGGKLHVRVVDPQPYSAIEDRALGFALRGVPAGGGENIYLGLAGIDANGKQQTINFFAPEREQFLEYEISQLVYRLAQPKPVVIGVISELPIFKHKDIKTGQIADTWVIIEKLRELFDIKHVIDTNVDDIDSGVDVLLVIHPRLLPENTLFAIDQFVLRGGRLIAFMDPNAEKDHSEAMFGEGFIDRSSSLEQLLTAWGVQYDMGKVVLDAGFAHTIPVTQYGQEVPHVGVLGLTDTAYNREEMITATLHNVNLASAGALAPIQGAAINFIPLLQSSDRAQLMDASAYATIGGHDVLYSKFSPSGQRYTFAARVTGNVKTAFPEGKPQAKSNEAVQSSAAPAAAQLDFLHESRAPINVILMADTDVLTDQMWVDVQDNYGQKTPVPWADNGDLAINMVDLLAGSSDLINVRARGSYRRPFERIDALEHQANADFRDEQKALQDKIGDTEKKIRELTAQQLGDNPQPLDAEQKIAFESYSKEKRQLRARLREVQLQLNFEVDQLGNRIRFINIAGVPVLLTLIVLLAALWRGRRR